MKTAWAMGHCMLDADMPVCDCLAADYAVAGMFALADYTVEITTRGVPGMGCALIEHAPRRVSAGGRH
ncbi:hypothetical protein A9L43_05745 [Pseudomonas mosselii]|nr:hypothetical protein AXZ07_04515 [Pseudomonas mosselii]ODB35005.1 hypothetical protein A9L43_05745 [Pseudomonas mosselii]